MTNEQSSNAKAVTELALNGYVLSITTRTAGDDPHILEELTFRTVAGWLYIVEQHLEKGKFDLEFDSVEERYCDEQSIKLADKWGDPRVTVWDTHRGQKRIGFLLNSDDNPQVAIDTWAAQHKAIARLKAKYPQNSPAAAPQAAPASAAPPQGMNTHNAPAAPQNDVFVANRAPTPNNPQYAEGQLVSFVVNKIVMGTGQGTATYALWGPLGPKYPLMTIFKNQKGKDENSKNYIAAKDTLVGLGLSVDAGKIEAVGKWQLITVISHYEGREYTNVLSLTAI